MEEQSIAGVVSKRAKMSSSYSPDKESRARELLDKVDRLSELPDSLIHHIVSFLPSTRCAIRTGILSRRWRNQWRHVPVLIFYHSYNDLKEEKHCKDIDNVLNQYTCSKVEKFQISAYAYPVARDPHFDHRIRFAINRDVKELILAFGYCSVKLPIFLYSYTLLVKLQIGGCILPPFEKLNWIHLKKLSASKCRFPDRALENILLGSPLLESLKLTSFDFNHLVIASKSLRKLKLIRLCAIDIGICCPNLEELCVKRVSCFNTLDNGNTLLCDTAQLTTQGDFIILCDTAQLTPRGDFIITSGTLKKLVLDYLKIYDLEISCPMLEELELLYGLAIKNPKLVNVQSLVSITLHLDNTDDNTKIKEILLQLQHVKELKLTLLCSKQREGADLSTLLLSNKCLILDCPNTGGISWVFRSFYALEKLIVKLPHRKTKFRKLMNYCPLNTHALNCCPNNLEIVQIKGLSERNDYGGVSNFI